MAEPHVCDLQGFDPMRGDVCLACTLNEQRMEIEWLRVAITKIQSEVRIRSSFCIIEVVDEIAGLALGETPTTEKGD